VGRVRIDVYDEILDVVISKQHKKNVRMINNITTQRETKGGEAGIDIYGDPWGERFVHWVGCK